MSLGMKYITRYDYQGSHGYWVRVQRRLAKNARPLVISQFFSDTVSGGKRAALAAAKVYRDAALELAPPLKKAVHQPPGVTHSYGYVKESVLSKKGPGGNKVERRVFTALYKNARGEAKRKTFSIDKWSRAEAKQKAIDWAVKKAGDPNRIDLSAVGGV